ncbi:hypothetical protein J2Z79_000324 [Symbiobacterium terraclitae]|uniref:Lipoprotein n=1 Tax=Symbiobacterium terraclitae TaxID=557451 RepID=A0ABS4JPT5_9FIRM|nr:hypothetical protein [Symbiobacterium terraclitae]MBP2016950.1 hypothetical protein [Symbiobacterium terraclitae]
MERIVRKVGTAWRGSLLWGALAFLALAACGGLHAWLSGEPAPPVIATWCEWFAALALLPYVFTMGAFGRWGQARAVAPVIHGWRAALVVFALDLLLRAALGLGLTPYYTG